MSAAAILLLLVGTGCGDPGATPDGGAGDAAPGPERWALDPPAEDGSATVVERAIDVTPAGAQVVFDGLGGREAVIGVDVELLDGTATADIDGWEPSERTATAAWWRARRHAGDVPTLSIAADAPARVRVRVVLRAVPPDADVDHSLAWTDPELVDDPAVVGLGRVMAAASADGHGGRLLDHWLRTFGRTAHSERPALVQLADALADAHGPDPSAWALDELPFTVTAVHNRLDLRNDDHCGELRVSMAVTDPRFPFIHLIFLFAQQPGVLDRSSTGALHCEETAFRWAWLAGRERERFLAEARAVAGTGLSSDAFLLAESLERTVGNWEWRQWRPAPNGDPATRGALPDVLENPPLFQTLDVARLNAPGTDRDDFLAWVAAEAPGIEARRVVVPPRFSPPSARAAEGVPRQRPDLDGLDPVAAPRAEALQTALDRVGCPGCHARSPTFLQTNADRSFSPFYTDELAARAAALDRIREGTPVPPPFGALQD